jgi:hypothetical protein
VEEEIKFRKVTDRLELLHIPLRTGLAKWIGSTSQRDLQLVDLLGRRRMP